MSNVFPEIFQRYICIDAEGERLLYDVRAYWRKALQHS